MRKHGFSFADACEVFHARMLVEIEDREEYGAERWIGIGQIQNRTVVIVYTAPDDEHHASSRCKRQSGTSDKPMTNISRTDCEHIDGMTDEDIDTSDIPPLTNAFFHDRAMLPLVVAIAAAPACAIMRVLASSQAFGTTNSRCVQLVKHHRAAQPLPPDLLNR